MGTFKYMRGLAFSPDGKKLAAVCGDAPTPLDGRLLVWDAAAGQRPLLLKEVNEQAMIFSVVYSSDGRRLFTGGYDNSIMAWDSQTGEHLFTLKGHSTGVLSLAASPDGKRLISASGDNHNSGTYAEVIVWDLSTRQQVLTLKGHEDAIHGVVISPDGRLLATASRDGRVLVWDGHEPAAE